MALPLTSRTARKVPGAYLNPQWSTPLLRQLAPIPTSASFSRRAVRTR